MNGISAAKIVSVVAGGSVIGAGAYALGNRVLPTDPNPVNHPVTRVAAVVGGLSASVSLAMGVSGALTSAQVPSERGGGALGVALSAALIGTSALAMGMANALVHQP